MTANKHVSKYLLLALMIGAMQIAPAAAQTLPARARISSTAFVVPKETAPEGEGYFSIIEGRNERLYIGTHANALNSWLVEFDPATNKMNVVVDAQKAIGSEAKGVASQAKIHTRNNAGDSGKIYFATKQGYPEKGEKREDYPGGYPMVYDPANGTTRVYPIPVRHQGIISITPDESRGVAYLSTCSDERPADGSHFGILDLKSGNFRDLLDCKHMYAFIVVDYLGRAYHPTLGGEIVRYDPKSDRVEHLKQTIDGAGPSGDSHLADEFGHPINWDISPDGKTLYAVPMSTNQLYAYDLTGSGQTFAGRSLGPLLPDAKNTDCRAMCVGPSGRVWASVTESRDGINWHHLISYSAEDRSPRDRGIVTILNPDYTALTDGEGKPLPYHAGIFKTEDGTVTSKYVTMGVCEAKSGNVYCLVLHPYTLLQIRSEDLK